MAPYLPPEKNIENMEVRGFTWRHLLVGGLMYTTVMGGIFSVKSDIAENKKDNVELKKTVTDQRLDIDVLKQHDGVQDGKIEGLERQVYSAAQDHTQLKPFYAR